MNFPTIAFSFLRWPATDNPTAGVFGVTINDVHLHILMRDLNESIKIWGRSTERCDHCLEYFGLGPLALLVWPGGKSFLKALTTIDLNAGATAIQEGAR